MSSVLNKKTINSLYLKGLASLFISSYNIGERNDMWELTQLGFDEINKMETLKKQIKWKKQKYKR